MLIPAPLFRAIYKKILMAPLITQFLKMSLGGVSPSKMNLGLMAFIESSFEFF